jgi:hypothetical protein
LLTEPAETPAAQPSENNWTFVSIIGGMLFIAGILFILYKKLS